MQRQPDVRLSGLPSSGEATTMEALRREIARVRREMGLEDPRREWPAIGQARAREWVNSHLPIGWPVMPKRPGAILKAYAQKVARRLLRWYINPIVDQQNAHNGAVGEALGELAISLTAEIEHAARRGERQLGLLSDRLRRLEQGHLRVGVEARSAPSEADVCFDAFQFSLIHRGPRDLAARVCDYDDLLRGLSLRSALPGGTHPVLDVGCGRGEFLAHAIALGVDAYGIETDEDAVAWCRAAGLDVRPADALQHLRGLAVSSLGAVTAIQVIEHLDVGSIITFLKEAGRVLEPGGLLIVETVNPTCVWALVNAYLLDPSHRTPLHPELARFLAEQAGLIVDEIRFLRPVPPPVMLDQTADVTGASLDSRDNVGRLNSLLFGPQDYALIAHRSGSG
jgi:SAM-dependent methyltransferase